MGSVPVRYDPAFPCSCFPGRLSAAEHPVDRLGLLVPLAERVGPGSVGDSGGQRFGTDPSDVNLMPPLLELVVQVVRDLDRISGHLVPPCGLPPARRFAGSEMAPGGTTLLAACAAPLAEPPSSGGE